LRNSRQTQLGLRRESRASW